MTPPDRMKDDCIGFAKRERAGVPPGWPLVVQVARTATSDTGASAAQRGASPGRTRNDGAKTDRVSVNSSQAKTNRVSINRDTVNRVSVKRGINRRD